MSHETKNLHLDDDGSVYLIVIDEDGERDLEGCGDIESCSYRIPFELDEEFEELVDVWSAWKNERRGYERGINTAWQLAKGRA